MTQGDNVARAITHGPQSHWFGYYDMPCWDSEGRYLLSLGVDFEDRPPAADDVATIGVTDVHTGEYSTLTQTRAFNWQQGAMMHWLPGSEDTIIYNDREGDRFVAVLLNVRTGDRCVLPRATSDVGLGGKLALCLNFARIAETRPGYGYAGLADPFADQAHPRADGVQVMDLASGARRLAVSMQDVYEYLGRPPGMNGAKMWFNHTLLNPSETRFAFLVRWRQEAETGWRTLMFTAAPDGTDLKLLLGDGMVSHYDWRNDREILAWTRIGDRGDAFYLIDEPTGEATVVGAGLLTQDGHCSYSHNGKWILTDTYPDRETFERRLLIYVPDDGRLVEVGRYASPPPYVGEIRCDLHPRWSRDDRQICFDSVHEGQRQVYVIDTPEMARPEA